MTRLRDTIDRTPEYVNFINELKQFHNSKGTTLQAEPVLGGRRLDLYKIFQVVVNSGGFDEVTKNRGWKQVGDIFQFPSTCTNSAYILKGVYIRNLLGWEEEKLWSKNWKPPKELLGPHAHKSSTLAGKAYRSSVKKTSAPTKSSSKSVSSKASKSVTAANASAAAVAAAAATAAALFNPLNSLQQFTSTPAALFDFSNMDMDPLIYATSQDQLKFESQKIQPIDQQQDMTFNQKDRIMFALQFGQREDVNWALDQIVTISFECPKKLELVESPFLLQLLVSLAQPCLLSHATDHALPTSASDTLNNMLKNENDNSNGAVTGSKSTSIMPKLALPPISKPPVSIKEINTTSTTDTDTLNIILKVLHILRNFSFLSNHVPTLAKHASVKELLVQSLQTSMSTGHVELGRHSMDVLENIAGHMELLSAHDSCLQCIHTVVAAHDRYLVIGSIRTLTWLTMNKTNHQYLESSPVLARVSQMLLSNDEELVGTALEYIYQHTRVSVQSRFQFLTSPHCSAYIGLMISLLMTKSKYFCTRFIQEDTALPTPNPTTTTTAAATTAAATTTIGTSNGFVQNQQQQDQTVIPRVPDLTVYQKLDEPFRCLGWLKDKFEVANRSSVLSLDDIYLLYEARFGLEKALKMRDFYTVMKIAFPKVSTSGSSSLLGSPVQSAPVVEGLNIIGIQIKMSILQDRPQVPCKWANCSLLFDDTFTLQRHVLHDHMTSISAGEQGYVCSWSICKSQQNLFENKDDWISHLRTHFYNQIGESCCNSPVQSPEPSLSSSPSTPSSNISSLSTTTPVATAIATSPMIKTAHVVDVSEVQGIALVASHLLNWLSKDPQSSYYFIPYEKELTAIAEQRPKLATHVWSICSNFKSSSLKSSSITTSQILSNSTGTALQNSTTATTATTMNTASS